LPAYARRQEAIRARERNVVAQSIAPRGINLPCSASLTRDEVAVVGAAFRRALGQ
jgi:dTDP-4-amino-4,6-dideoxygalactose transaminase